MDQAPKPHDALVHRIFGEGDPQHIADVLRSALPGRLARAIDWRSLTRVEGHFVDDALRSHQTDQLFTARMRRRPVLLYVLLDAKSTPDRGTPLQLLRYITRIWERHRAEHGRSKRLPPVIPFVLYSGSAPWTGSRSLRDLVDLRGIPRPLARLLRQLQPDLTFLVDDLSAQDDAALRARTMSALPRLTLMVLRQRRHRDRAAATAEVLRWLDVVQQVCAAPSGRAMMQVIMNYLVQTRQLDLPRLRIELRATLGPDAEDELMKTTADILREEGRAEGQADLLLQQLELRFGPLPKTVVARVRKAGTKDLQNWARAVLTAPTLDAVFAAAS